MFRNYINKEDALGRFILASISFSDFSDFSQILKFRIKFLLIFDISLCAFPHVLHGFSKINTR